MESTRQHRALRDRIVPPVVALLTLLIPGTSAWSQGQGRPAADTRPRSAATGPSVVVHDGRLSVDLQDADLGAVLAQIGRQAGIRMSAGPSAGKRVSARFADVELEAGLRRLLRLASLSHLFLYTQGLAGSVAISEVRVLGEGKEPAPRPATVVAPGLQNNKQNAGIPVRKAWRQAPAVVEMVQEPTPDPGQGEPSEVTRRFREVFQLSKGMGRRPPDGQESSPSETKYQGNEQRGIGGAR
jgi:hypothetical protein